MMRMKGLVTIKPIANHVPDYQPPAPVATH